MAFAATLFLVNPSVTAVSNTPIAYAQEKTTTTAPAVSSAILCNCYAYVRSQYPDFPPTWELENNTTPHVGAVVIFDYDGLPHYGIISKMNADGFWLTDSNYGGCGIRNHYIEWTSRFIKGFWASK